MRSKVLILLVCGLVLFAGENLAYGQTAKEELATLRNHLDLPETTLITVSTSPSWPKQTPLKVFLALGLDMYIRATFVGKIDGWNTKNGAKYGRVEVVDEMAKADLILVRYTDQEKVTSNTGSYVAPVMVYDPASKTFKTTPVARTYSTNSVPAYDYMIIPSQKGLEIIWREIGPAPVGETTNSGQALRDQLFRFLKSRK